MGPRGALGPKFGAPLPWARSPGPWARGPKNRVIWWKPKRTAPKFRIFWRARHFLGSHMRQVMANQVLGTFVGFWSNHTCWPSHRVGLRPTFGPADLARLPGLLCLGSAELVLPCSLPCFALPMLPTSLIREAALRAASTKGGGAPRRPPLWIPCLLYTSPSPRDS